MLMALPVLAAQQKPAEEYAPVCRYQNDCPYSGECDGDCYYNGGRGHHHGCYR
jgi:hypothetical protein